MANQRDIKNRIGSISNTRKITSTMEMVSTSKMKKVQGRMEMSKPYEEKVTAVIANLVGSGAAAEHNPLFREIENPSRILVLQITGNRGLCGSFNTNIINNTLEFKKEQESAGRDVNIYNIGRKGQTFLNFIGQELYKTELNLEDKVTFEDIAKLGTELTQSFLSLQFHEVYISYMKYISNSSQKPAIVKLLPISVGDAEEFGKFPTEMKREYYFHPNPERIFSYILPLYFKVKLFLCFLETGYAEHFARMVAMKNATDASEEMIKDLTITYNRVRQAKITNEIAEIVGGASALE